MSLILSLAWSSIQLSGKLLKKHQNHLDSFKQETLEYIRKKEQGNITLIGMALLQLLSFITLAFYLQAKRVHFKIKSRSQIYLCQQFLNQKAKSLLEREQRNPQDYYCSREQTDNFLAHFQPILQKIRPYQWKRLITLNENMAIESTLSASFQKITFSNNEVLWKSKPPFGLIASSSFSSLPSN